MFPIVNWNRTNYSVSSNACLFVNQCEHNMRMHFANWKRFANAMDTVESSKWRQTGNNDGTAIVMHQHSTNLRPKQNKFEHPSMSGKTFCEYFVDMWID